MRQGALGPELARRYAPLASSLAVGIALWEIAGRLRMPYAGVFLVVAAESAQLGEDPLDGLGNRLATQDIRSAWRLASGIEAGLISCGSAGRAATAVGLVRDVATTRVAISPPFERFDGVRDAWRLARHAMSSFPVGAGGVRQFVATPIALMSVSDPAVSRRVARAVLGEDCATLETPAGLWHAVLSLDPGGVIFEVKRGPYTPVAPADYSWWSPAEGTPEMLAWYARAQPGDDWRP